MNQLLVICGMYRSGTSALAQALMNLGYYAGSPEDLALRDEFNQDGYFENAQIMRFNHTVTAQYGLLDFIAEPLPDNWEQYPATEDMLSLGKDLIAKLYGGREFAGWKDPRVSRLLPFYLRLFEEQNIQAKFLVPVRNPVAVAKSLAKKDFVDFEAALGLWINTTLGALHHLVPSQVLLIDHSRLLSDPSGSLEKILDRFGYAVPSPDLIRGAAESVRATLVRHDPEDLPSKFSFLVRVYGLVQAILLDDAGFERGAFEDRIEALYSEWHSWSRLLAGRHTPPATVALTGDSTATDRVPACQWSEVDLEVACSSCRNLVLSVSSAGIAYLKDAEFLVDGIASKLDTQFGPHCKGYDLAPNLLRFVVFEPGPHLIIKGPAIGKRFRLRAKVFPQTGIGFMHASYQALLQIAKRGQS